MSMGSVRGVNNRGACCMMGVWWAGLLYVFDAQELELMMCGFDEIDINVSPSKSISMVVGEAVCS